MIIGFVAAFVVANAPAQIIANFSDGNGTGVDGYVGSAGDGWVDAWQTARVSNSRTSFNNSVESGNSMNSGGNYLSVDFAYTDRNTSNQAGTVYRTFDSALVPNSAIQQYDFQFRLDSAIVSGVGDSNSKYVIMGNTVSNSAFSTINDATWTLQAYYTSSGGGTFWGYTNGSGTLVSTGITPVVGTTYSFSVLVDPTNKTYSFNLTDGGLVNYTSPEDLLFVNQASPQVNQIFFATQMDADHIGELNYSIDSIAISSVPEPASVLLTAMGLTLLLGRRNRLG